MKYSFLLVLSFCFAATIDFSKVMSPKDVSEFKTKLMSKPSMHVKDLVNVIKNKDYPIENRWSSIFMLGQSLGDKSIPFLKKFCSHPNWMLRLASLKTLTKLNYKKEKTYKKLLKDKAMVVRLEALSSVKKLKLNSLAPVVWSMLYDKQNYVQSQGKMKRAAIINKVITLVGDLGFKPARKALVKMSKSKKYNDLSDSISYSLKLL